MTKIESLSSGILQKWRIDEYLYKDSMYLYSKEPIAEVICSDILDLLNLDHIEYKLVDNDIGVDSISNKLSICKLDSNIIKISDIILDKDIDIFLKHLLEIDDKLGLLNMFIFDALVSNPDRHINNIYLKDGKVIILDNGQALSSMNGFEVLKNHWRSQPFEPFHDDQLKFLFKHFNDILDLSIINKLNLINKASLDKILNNYLEGSRKEDILQLILENKNNIIKLYEELKTPKDNNLEWK